MKVTGHWDGKLLDASGVSALVALDLQVSPRGRVKGRFTATILPAVEDICGGATRGPVTSGPIEGAVDADGRLDLRTALETGGEKIVAHFTARPGKPDPHARAAFYGGYEVVEGASALTLQGGACVLWQYVGTKRGEVS